MFSDNFQMEENEDYMNSIFGLSLLFPIGESYIEEDRINNRISSIPINENENLEDNNDTRERSFFKVTRKNNKLGRKRKIENEKEILEENEHNKYSSDNAKRKIQVHFISFIITFINFVLKELGYTDEFCNINYDFKINVNKNNIEKLKNPDIGYIFSQTLSSKYKKKNPDKNKIIYQRLKNIPVLRNIFAYNYKDFFKDFYYNKENDLNLNKFGLNINIKYKYGKKIKMYNDLKEKNNKDPEYIKRLDECVNNLLK